MKLSAALTPKIIFEDANLIVLSKPAGLLSQGEEKGDVNLVDWLRDYFGRYYVGLVHRLDRNASGLMVVAKRTKAARRLTEALQEGRLTRVYQAWIEGRLDRPKRWKHYLAKDETNNTVRVVGASSGAAKEAVLFVKPLSYGTLDNQAVTLAEFRLETGRSHQIRVQAAYENHSLIGDIKYGAALKAGSKKMARPLLHSSFMEFPHPISGEILKFSDLLPSDMQAITITETLEASSR